MNFQMWQTFLLTGSTEHWTGIRGSTVRTEDSEQWKRKFWKIDEQPEESKSPNSSNSPNTKDFENFGTERPVGTLLTLQGPGYWRDFSDIKRKQKNKMDREPSLWARVSGMDISLLQKTVHIRISGSTVDLQNIFSFKVKILYQEQTV